MYYPNSINVGKINGEIYKLKIMYSAFYKADNSF